MSVRIRYFAAAKAAAGQDAEHLDGATLRDVLDAAVAARGGTRPRERGGTGPRERDGAVAGGAELARVIGLSSFLVDGVAVTDLGTALADGATVDVLPPFAGG